MLPVQLFVSGRKTEKIHLSDRTIDFHSHEFGLLAGSFPLNTHTHSENPGREPGTVSGVNA